MGNCSVTQNAVTSWADDGEWVLSSPTAEEARAPATSRRNDDHMAEVTIRITRRQLQELMEKRAGGGGAPKSRRAAAELLADVMNVGQVYQHCPAAVHWKPALRSIPEAVES